ncbi:glycosyl transferase, partial [Oceanisphaera arctica]
IAEALTGHDWGRFDVTITGRHPMLAAIAFMMNLRSRLTGIATGDQAIFVCRSSFEAVGGFPDQPLMEDIELSKRLKRLGPPACLQHKVTTSGRRWEQKGLWRTILLMWRLRFAYWRGASPEQLARAYR